MNKDDHYRPALINLFELEAHFKCGIFSGPTIQKIRKITKDNEKLDVYHKQVSLYTLRKKGSLAVPQVEPLKVL